LTHNHNNLYTPSLLIYSFNQECQRMGTAMTREAVLGRILEIISEIAEDEDLSDLDPDIPLRDQLELDSVDFLRVIMELDERYGVQVPEEDFVELTTLNRCIAYLQSKFDAVSEEAGF